MSELCECTRGPKTSPTQGCRECNALDGRGEKQREIILLLRTDGPLTTAQIATQTGYSVTDAFQQMSRMRKAGYVQKRLVEDMSEAVQDWWWNKEVSRVNGVEALWSMTR